MSLIAAVDSQFGIARDGNIPWLHEKWGKDDLEFFRSVTNDKRVIMGRKTWDSLPVKPLPRRENIIVTNNKSFVAPAGCRVECGQLPFIGHRTEVIIGGAEIYRAALETGQVNTLYLTMIDMDYKCDKQFPIASVFPKYRSQLLKCDYLTYEGVRVYRMIIELRSTMYDGFFGERICALPGYDQQRPAHPITNYGEMGYLELLRFILATGDRRATRNGSTLSVFGYTLEFSLSRFPLMTTKAMPLRAIFEELMMFIRGETDSNKLVAKGVNIWKHNTSREFLKDRGLNYPEGEMGPMYGYQWRNFGKPHPNAHEPASQQGDAESVKPTPSLREQLREQRLAARAAAADTPDAPATSYDPKIDGIDQFARCIDLIYNNSTDRSNLMTTLDPCVVNQGVLWPCHGIVTQFYVANGMLSCTMYQRSADMFLGVPFNIASYALLVYLICDHVNYRRGQNGIPAQLTPGRLIITFGDAHIYSDHVPAAYLQLLRAPGYAYPELKITNSRAKIEDYQYEDIKLVRYDHHPRIFAKVQ